MILIQPIKLNTENNLSLCKNQGSRIQPANPDSFKRTCRATSFTGIEREMNLHYSIKEVEEFFANAFAKIKKQKTVEEKSKLSNTLFNKFRSEIMSSRDQFKLNTPENDFAERRVHELNNPIGEMFKLNDLIYLKRAQNISNEKYDNFFKYISDRMINVIKRYEDFIEKGIDKKNTKPIEIFELSLSAVCEQAKQKNIQIKIIGSDIFKKHEQNLSNKTERLRNGDLYDVFLGVIHNAVKYSPENSTVTIKFSQHKKSGKNFFVFSVKDKGIGIPKSKNQQKKAVEGERASNAKASGIYGTGFGLKRVNDILSRIDGHLKIKSPLNIFNRKYPGTKISCFIKLND